LGSKVVEIFAVTGGQGPWRAPGLQPHQSPASLMIRPCAYLNETAQLFNPAAPRALPVHPPPADFPRHGSDSSALRKSVNGNRHPGVRTITFGRVWRMPRRRPSSPRYFTPTKTASAH